MTPPPVLTLEELIAWKALAYPSLYFTRENALEHLYIVIGNGYEWIGGRLADDDFYADYNRLERAKWNGALRQVKAGRRPTFTQKGLISILDKKTPYEAYPLSEQYSALCNLPDDAQPDYVLGALEACDLLPPEQGERWKARIRARFPEVTNGSTAS